MNLVLRTIPSGNYKGVKRILWDKKIFHQTVFLSIFDSVYKLFTKYAFTVNRYFVAHLCLGDTFPGTG